MHLAAGGCWLSLTPLRVNFSDDGHTIVLPPESRRGAVSSFALNWTGGEAARGGEAAGGRGGGGLAAFLSHLTDTLVGQPAQARHRIALRRRGPRPFALARTRYSRGCLVKNLAR